jgi:hypothetical protein
MYWNLLSPVLEAIPFTLVCYMQISTSLLCNLLDVIEEVQLTQIEIRNLVQTSFYSPSGNIFYVLPPPFFLCFCAITFSHMWFPFKLVNQKGLLPNQKFCHYIIVVY